MAQNSDPENEDEVPQQMVDSSNQQDEENSMNLTHEQIYYLQQQMAQ